MIDAGELESSGESHEPIHRRAEDRVFAQNAGLTKLGSVAARGVAVAVIAFPSLQRERQAELVNERKAVCPGSKNDGVGFDHVSCARSNAAHLAVDGQNVLDFGPGS